MTSTATITREVPEIESAPSAPTVEELEDMTRDLTLRDLVRAGAPDVEQNYGSWYGHGSACVLGTALLGAKKHGLL